MAGSRWFKFTRDYDHKWPSLSTTAFKAGMHLRVKNEVADAAHAAGAGHDEDRPENVPEMHVDEADTGSAPALTAAAGDTGGETGNPDASTAAQGVGMTAPAVTVPGDPAPNETSGAAAKSGKPKGGASL